MRDKLEAPAALPSRATSDVRNALISLGYSEKEAAQAVKQIDPAASAEEGIRMGLKLLSRGAA